MTSNELKAARREKGLRLKSVSEALNLSLFVLADFERGATKPCPETLEDLKKLYGVA